MLFQKNNVKNMVRTNYWVLDSEIVDRLYELT